MILYHLRLTYQELGRLRLLLDSDYRRILRESPDALNDPQTYASAIDKIRSQAIYLLDKHMEREQDDRGTQIGDSAELENQ